MIQCLPVAFTHELTKVYNTRFYHVHIFSTTLKMTTKLLGQKIPDVELYISTNPTEKDKVAKPSSIKTSDYFKNKKVLLFGIPIPFSPVCSGQQLPELIKHIDEIKANDVDEVAVVNGYDSYFTFKMLGLKQPEPTLLSDPNLALLEPLHLVQTPAETKDSWPVPVGPNISKRFWMMVEDGEVKEYMEDRGGEFEKTSVQGVLKGLQGRLRREM
ncbi:hypothetical protein HDV05_001495 [Chytridiales sp. JEL 0842]|nr:hypothetical protein HDV05_001495 [Chytridiales sp. JEL 0842]